MKSMSFNLLCAYITPERSTAIVETIKKYDPDTVGIQEATVEWMRILKESLPEYEFVGVGRDANGGGEHSALGFKKSVFELLKTETRWLTATPDVYSKVENSLCPRIYTYATLKCKKCGKVITYINTHLDHADFKDPKNKVRCEQAGYLAEFIKSLGDSYVVLSGDFNSLPGDESLNIIKSAGLSLTSEIAEITEDTNTFDDNAIIDYIFVRKELTDVREYRVCLDKVNGKFLSDHRPIIADYKFK